MSAHAGKVAVITGASRGVGAGLAEHFHAQGLKVGLCSRSAPVLEGAEGVVRRELDVRDAGALAELAEAVARELGPIDLWINNAAVLEPVTFQRDLDPQALADHLAINVVGVLNGTQAFLAHRAPEAVLLNISSGAALKGYAAWSAYCAGKAALDRLSECLALEEGERGLRVHAVAPGVIDTDMQRTIRSKSREEFPMLDKFLQLKADDAFNSPDYVARELLAIAFDPAARPDEVVVRLASEKG